MRMMLRAFRAAVFAFACIAAAEASAQEMTISAYDDQWVDANYVHHGVDYFDDTWACSHGNYTTLATLTGPTGFASWEPGGMSSYVGLPYAEGNFFGESALSFDCSCVYPDRVEYTAYLGVPFQMPTSCGDERDNIREEYRAGQVAWTPACSDFSNSGGSQHFSWSELNGGFSTGNPHNPWGIIKSSLTTGLESARSNYNRGGVLLTSGYRCPHGNANSGGVSNSRHMFGDAADMYSNDHTWTEQEFGLLRAAVTDAGASWTSSWNTYTDHHLHGEWD